MQKVDGSTLYDSFEVSFNAVDKASILKINNIDILQSITNKALASNVYTKEEITNNDIMFANTLNNKADKTYTCLKTEVDSKFTTSNLLINTKVNSSSVDLGDIYRLIKSVDSNSFPIERVSLNSVSNSNVWISLFSIDYDVVLMHCKLYVDKTYIFAKLNKN